MGLFPKFTLTIDHSKLPDKMPESAEIDAWLHKVSVQIAQTLEDKIFAAMQRGETCVDDEDKRIRYSWPALPRIPTTKADAVYLLGQVRKEMIYGAVR